VLLGNLGENQEDKMVNKIRIKVTGPSGKSIRRTLNVSLPKARKLAKKIFGKKVIVKKIPLIRRKPRR